MGNSIYLIITYENYTEEYVGYTTGENTAKQICAHFGTLGKNYSYEKIEEKNIDFIKNKKVGYRIRYIFTSTEIDLEEYDCNPYAYESLNDNVENKEHIKLEKSDTNNVVNIYLHEYEKNKASKRASEYYKRIICALLEGEDIDEFIKNINSELQKQ